MEKKSYSRSEVLAAGSNLPERGPLCHECGAHVPFFEELSESVEARVRECIRNAQYFMAMDELRASTGCSLEWAKLWGNTTAVRSQRRYLRLVPIARCH